MLYLKSWLAVLVGMMIYRYINPETHISWQEHAAGAYFSAITLITHYVWSRHE